LRAAGLFDAFTPEPVAAWLSPRLRDASDDLACQWRQVFSSRERYITDFIAAIADNLLLPAHVELSGNAPVMHKAAELGRMGLSIVRDSLDACGGTVLLQSSEGVGTTITLSWPARTTPAR
jgi:hypothetical protein